MEIIGLRIEGPATLPTGGNPHAAQHCNEQQPNLTAIAVSGGEYILRNVGQYAVFDRSGPRNLVDPVINARYDPYGIGLVAGQLAGFCYQAIGEENLWKSFGRIGLINLGGRVVGLYSVD